MLRSLSVVFGLLIASLSGCASVEAASAIAETDRSLVAAEREGAPEYAKYPYFKAQAFLAEAKLKNGYGEYDAAHRYATDALALSREAATTARSRADLKRRRLRGDAEMKRKKKRVQKKKKRDPNAPAAPPPERQKHSPPILPPILAPGGIN